MRSLALLSLALSLASSAKAQSFSPQTGALAAQKGFNWAVADAANFTNANGCIACHRQGATVYGASISSHRGVQLSSAALANNDFLAKALAGAQQPGGNWTHYGSYVNAKSGYALYGLAGYTQYSGSTAYLPNLESGVRWAMGAVYPFGDGSVYLPQDHGSVPTTWDWTIPTAQAAAAASAALSADPALADAPGFHGFLDKLALGLENQYYASRAGGPTSNWATQPIVYANIGLVADGRGPQAPAPSGTGAQTMRDELLSRQNGDGGWGYYAGSNSDPLNTGEVLYALCLDGVRADLDPRVGAGLTWLVNTQNPSSGQWDLSGHASDLPTTYASLALGCYGTLNSAVQPTSTGTTVAVGSPSPQQIQFGVVVTNSGYVPTNYTVTVSGGLPGTTSTASPPTLSIAPNASATSTISVTLPANIPSSSTVPVSATVSYQNGTGISQSTVNFVAQAGPQPSAAAPATITAFAGGAIQASPGQLVNLSATVTDAATGAAITSGSVTFFSGQIALGTVFASSDGLFHLPYRVPATLTDSQTLTASYGGAGGASEHHSSSGAATLSLPPKGVRPPAPAIAARVDAANAADGDTVTFDIENCPPDTDVNVYEDDAPLLTLHLSGSPSSFSFPLAFGGHSLSFTTGALGSVTESVRTGAIAVSNFPLPPSLTLQPAALGAGAVIEGDSPGDAQVVAYDDQIDDVLPAPEVFAGAGHWRHQLVKRRCHKRPVCLVHRLHYHQRRPGKGGALVESRRSADTGFFWIWDDLPGTTIVAPATGSVVDTDVPQTLVRYTGIEAASQQLPAAGYSGVAPAIAQTRYLVDGGKLYAAAPVATGPLFTGLPAQAPSQTPLTMAKPGPHTLDVAAQDTLGNADAASSTFTYSPSIATIKSVTAKLLLPGILAGGQSCSLSESHDEGQRDSGAKGAAGKAGTGGKETDEDDAGSHGEVCEHGLHVGNPHCAQKLTCGQLRSLERRLDDAAKAEGEHDTREMAKDLLKFSKRVERLTAQGRVAADVGDVLQADAIWKAQR